MDVAVPSQIRTPRLTLRPLRAEDAPAIVDGVGNYDVARWLAVVPYPYGPKDAEVFLSGPDAMPGRAWAIEDAAGMQGIISISGEFGYWLARPVWGRGYAVEAGAPLIAAYFRQPGAADLRAGYFAGNHRSRRVLEKLGFRADGTARVWACALGQEVESHRMVLRATDLETPARTL